MQRDTIIVRGARENNLQNVSLDIPKHAITVFTGVSGSGKSSLVFDTIAAEAQRQLNETFTMFVRTYLPSYGQPDVDVLENLSTAIIINQKRIGGNSRSTVGTITDIYAVLRLLFSRIATPWAGWSNVFSFNDPEGMCPECGGVGKKTDINTEALFDRSRSLNEGAFLFEPFRVGTYNWKVYAESGLFDNDKPLRNYSDEEWQTLLYGAKRSVQFRTSTGPMVKHDYEGVIDKFTRLYLHKEGRGNTQEKIAPFVTQVVCPLCHGARLSQKALAAKIDGRNIADHAAMEVADLIPVLKQIDDDVAATMVPMLIERLQHIVDIGLGYLTLDRETSTLSGGESQRIKIVRHLTSSLTDMIYVFDEPSIGLHPHDVERLNGLLTQLRDKGNTILVVEHDPDVIAIADHVVDMGPHAGTHGGTIVYEGDLKGLSTSQGLTGQFMRQTHSVKTDYRTATGQLPIKHATLHNLKDVSVNIPSGILTVVTGVAGSGKSTRIYDVFLAEHPEAIMIDQSPLRGSMRSNPATYTGIMDELRRLFARANGVSAALFSFNSEGACPNCNGLGVIYTELAYLDPIKRTCEVCDGKRFKPEVLAYTLRGKSISDVLELSIGEALDYFEEPEICRTIESLVDVGVGYLTLGQPLSTLSGGEAQRIKLASVLHQQGSLYVLDEPTTGLHMSDVARLLAIIERIVDNGNTVVVIEHNLDVITNADWLIDLGPEGGSKGGEVLFEGTPREILTVKQSLTGPYVARMLQA